MSWIIVDDASGEVVGSGYTEQPKVRAGQTAYRQPAGPGYSWSTTLRGFVKAQTIAEVEAELLATIKAEAERRKMLLLTSGGAKKTEYAEKRAEIVAWDALGSPLSAILVAFAALAPATQAVRFAHTIADAAAFGDKPADAITRFRAGVTRAGTTAAICAVEAVGCTRIKAATTAAAKRAAAAAIVWPA